MLQFFRLESLLLHLFDGLSSVRRMLKKGRGKQCCGETVLLVIERICCSVVFALIKRNMVVEWIGATTIVLDGGYHRGGQQALTAFVFSGDGFFHQFGPRSFFDYLFRIAVRCAHNNELCLVRLFPDRRIDDDAAFESAGCGYDSVNFHCFGCAGKPSDGPAGSLQYLKNGGIVS